MLFISKHFESNKSQVEDESFNARSIMSLILPRDSAGGAHTGWVRKLEKAPRRSCIQLRKRERASTPSYLWNASYVVDTGDTAVSKTPPNSLLT